jgi:hypothetical protein
MAALIYPNPLRARGSLRAHHSTIRRRVLPYAFCADLRILGTCPLSPTSAFSGTRPRRFPSPDCGAPSLRIPGTCKITDFLAVQRAASRRVLFPFSLDTCRRCASIGYMGFCRKFATESLIRRANHVQDETDENHR